MSDKRHMGRLEGWSKSFVTTEGLGFVINATNGSTGAIVLEIQQPDGSWEVETKNLRYTLGTPASA